MNPHFLQSAAWQSFQEALGRKVYRQKGIDWEFMAILEPGTRLSPSRLYCPYGPTVSSIKGLKSALKALTKLATSLGVKFVRVEPLGVKFNAKDFRLKKVNYSQPAHTWQIDLNRSSDEIISQMKQNNRNIYRNYRKKGLSYRSSNNPNDCKYLIKLLHGVAAHNNITIHSDEYLQTQADVLLPINSAKLHFISLESKVIAAALTYEDEKTCYYAHAGASHEYRKLSTSTALLAEIIINAKKDGKLVCDLYGITTSQDKNHRWAGFTRFKKSFGGYEVDLSETYDLPINKPAYKLYQVAKFLRHKIVKLKQRIK